MTYYDAPAVVAPTDDSVGVIYKKLFFDVIYLSTTSSDRETYYLDGGLSSPPCEKER